MFFRKWDFPGLGHFIVPSMRLQPQQDLVRSDYKTNKEVNIMAIFLHVGKPIEPIN
jgi:hypothetical protein